MSKTKLETCSLAIQMDPPAEELQTAEKLQAMYEEMRSRNEKQEIRIRDGEKQVWKLILYFIALEIAMLSSISGSSASLRKCQWIPFSLIWSVSLIFGLPITITVSGLLRAQYEYDRNLMEQVIIYYNKYIVQNGPNPSQSNNQQKQQQWINVQPDTETLYRRYAYVFVVVSALIAFTALIFFACHAILRDAD